MKRIFFGLLILFVALSAGCKGEGDVLATYKGGGITRGEFYDWIKSNHYAMDSIIKSKKRQKNRLRMMMIERLTVEKAKGEGFDKSDDFKGIHDRITESQLMSILYKKEIREKAKFQEPAIRVSHILFRVKEYKAEKNKRKKFVKDAIDKTFDKKMGEAKGIIERLNKGESFEEIAKKQSDDFSKKKGGDIGYITHDMMPAEYSEIAFSLDKGEYTKDPVRTAKGVYIIKVTDKKELTEKNIENVIEDKAQAKRIKARLQRKYAKDYIDRLTDADDVEEHFDKATSKKKEDVIFKVGDRVFTVLDLNNRIERTMRRSTGGQKKLPEISDKQREGLARSMFKFEILKRVAQEKGIEGEPEYKKDIDSKLNAALAREFTKKIGSSNIAVTRDEMLQEYKKNKDKRYYKMVMKKKKRVKVVEPFEKVKDKIERVLVNKKRRDFMKHWKDDLLKEYEFAIVESKLEGE
ncbi:MAG: peptidylprolyl isomerase [Spirochaetota bacterium]|nr:peptidylprolyl isomerase [Spirochaetota bacterium]